MLLPISVNISNILIRESNLISIGKRFYSFTSPLFKQKKTNMIPLNNFYIRYMEGSETFQAVLNYVYKPLNIDREFNFNRKISEPVDDFINRIKSNLNKIILNKTKKSNKKKTELASVAPTDIEIFVDVDNKRFDTTRSCQELFFEKERSEIRFFILDTCCKVIINSPWVDNLSLPDNIMVDFPIYPNKYEAVFVNDSDCQFKWFSSNVGKDPWTEIGEGFVYIPNQKDESKHIKLICTPINGILRGPDKEYISKCKVISGPGLCPFEERHAFTTQHLDNSGVRVVSYNILADVYAETDTAKTELFPYCPSHARSFDYRKQLYIKEILGYNADIICLQEVDYKVFNYDLNLLLGRQKLEGIYCEKGGTIREGVATFYNPEKFRLIKSYRIILGEEIQSNPVFTSLWNLLKPGSAAANSLIEKPSVLQVIVLERKDEKRDKLIIANTHLYFHPLADNIRLVQTGLCMEFIKSVLTQYEELNPQDRHSILFCGDFNSVPDCGAYLLMTSKHVPSDFKDWKSNVDEPIQGIELNQPYSIKSAYGTPKYTNFTKGFADCLDYIYYQTDYLQLKQAVPLPSEEDLRRHIALPSIVFPSDHVALVADFSWR